MENSKENVFKKGETVLQNRFKIISKMLYNTGLLHVGYNWAKLLGEY